MNGAYLPGALDTLKPTLIAVRYPQQRTILRQDDPAACFYVILSGSALISYKRITDGHTHTLDVLERGCTFGVGTRIVFCSVRSHPFDCCSKEKGLMTNARQMFTVTSNTELELLVLWKDVRTLA